MQSFLRILGFSLVIFISFSSGLLASDELLDQDQDPSEHYDLSSPYGAVMTHLKFLYEDNYKPEIAAKPFSRRGISADRAKELAIKLKQYYDAKGYYINPEVVPRQRDYFDSTTNTHTYQVVPLHPEIFVERSGNSWYYSNVTIAEIDRLHKEAFPFGTDKLLDILPRFGQKVYLGLHLWQLWGLLAIILFSVVLHKVFSWLLEELLFVVLEKYGYQSVGRKYLLPVAKPLSYFILIALALIFVRVLQLPIDYSRIIIKLLTIAQPIAGAIVFYRLVDVLTSYMEVLALRTESTLDDQLVPLVRKTLKFFVIVVGTLVVLREGLGVDIWPILTGLSIGGLALALAAQDTLKNFFGSIMIFIDKPFQVGHWITAGEIDGTVEEVGFRSTRVRTFRNSLVYVPNAKLADSTIDNNGLRQFRRYRTHITITYDTPPALIELFVEGLREIVEQHPKTRKEGNMIYFNELGSHSLDILFNVWFDVADIQQELTARHEILIQIMKLAESLGIRFAFPTQTLHLEEIPGQKSLTPVYPSDAAELRQRLERFKTTQFNNEQPN
jgi:MscS family membrane protein